MKFVIYTDASGEYRWRLLARNGRILADSAESYRRRIDCRRMAEKIAASTPAVEVHAG
jgi:uncharacterized protein YegP (UPF0339 family)